MSPLNQGPLLFRGFAEAACQSVGGGFAVVADRLVNVDARILQRGDAVAIAAAPFEHADAVNNLRPAAGSERP